jgi:UDP:flavonoid glycosyltransferase YjiC (YdhE family)
MSQELKRFLEDGPPPVVFTLGTALGSDAGPFYSTALSAARVLGMRAVLVGSGAPKRLAAGAKALALSYAPFAELFPRAAAVVHHGGIGTTGQAMRSGSPMLVVPRAWDQPDNAERVARLGIARVIPPECFTPSRVASELQRLLGGPYPERAAAARDHLREEDGVRAACDALEVLHRIRDGEG